MVKMGNNKKKLKEIKFVQKNISIKKIQDEWVKLNCLNLSRFVQMKLEEVMSK